MEWTLDFRVPVNGRVGEAEIIVRDDGGAVLTTEGGRLLSQPGRQKIAKRLAVRLEEDPEQVEQKLEAAWSKKIGEHLAAEQADGSIEGDKEDEGPERISTSTALVAMVRGSGAELFHTPDSDAFAWVQIGETRQVWPLRSKAFRQWLSRSYYNATQRTPGGQALADATVVMEGMAVHDGTEREAHVRVAENQGKLYLDLADPGWRVVEIDATGWRILDRSPIPFRRPRGLSALPAPERGGSVEELRPFLNVASADDWRLVVSFLLQAFRPNKPSPILCLHGENGCAKSTTARVIRSLIDPSVAPLRKEPREDRDLVIAASNPWLVAFDNLLSIPTWLSDALCRLATGGGLSTRELYSDKEEQIFNVMRPVVLTSIEDLASRGDLLERALVMRLPLIVESRRRTEAAFWKAFEAARPRILGALLDTVAAALANLGRVRLPSLPRMADFCEFATAAGMALGWNPGAFLDAYRGNRSDANELALDADVIVPHLRKFASAQAPWEGTASDLLTALSSGASDRETKARDWPKRPHSLSGRLRRLAPNLRAVGIQVEFFHSTDSSHRRLVKIVQAARQRERECIGASEPSEASDGSAQGKVRETGYASDAPASEERPRASESVRGASEPDATSKNSVRTQTLVRQDSTEVADASDASDAVLHPCSDDESDADVLSPWEQELRR